MSDVRALFVVAIFLLILPAATKADGLFRDVTPNPAAAAAPAPPPTMFPATVKRSRIAMLDAAYLAERVLPDAAMAVGATVAAKPMAVELPAFADLSLTLLGQRLQQMADGSVVWTGQVAGQPGSLAILVVDARGITGQVLLGSRAIEIRPLSGDAHSIVEIDPEAFPGHGHVGDDPPHSMVGAPPPSPEPGNSMTAPTPPPAPATRPPGEHGAAPAAATTVLNIFVAYTTATAAASSNIVGEIQLAIASANAAFANSGVAAQLNLVGTAAMTDYTEGTYTTSSAILNKFTTNNDGVMDSIHALRTANNADLVSLFVENLYDACGIAWIYNGRPEYGFTVVQRSCATANLTFAHETGHNLGAHHDRYVEPTATSNTYNYGYADLTAGFRTIMSYVDQCTAANVSCPRIGYFSSPDLTYQGRPLGVARSASGSADNVRRFNQTVASIARFRSASWTAVPESGWWWNAAESGRGYSLEVSGNNLFFAFYSYASDGTPVWYVSSGAMTSATVYYAAMQQYSGGQTLNGGYRAATATGTPGWVEIVFSNDRNGTIYFWTSSTGWSAARTITRFDFITNGAATGPATGYPQTGWWWNASEPGRGYFIEAQNSTMYVSFYMYNAAGQAIWYVASGAMVSSALFSGTISEYSGGAAFTASSYRGPSGSASDGPISIQFSSQVTATMTLPNGTLVPLTRFAF